MLSVLSRSKKNGTLKQHPGKSGCFSGDGSSEDGPGTCTKARDLGTGDATSIAISSDGRSLYVASQKTGIGGIAVFKRSVKTGTLHQLKGSAGCVTASAHAGCAIAREVDETSNLQITPDQKYLYASDYNGTGGIAIFRRNAKTGALHQLKGSDGCVTADGTTNQSPTTKVCRAMPNLNSPWDVATPDNRFAYVPSISSLVQAFRRDSQGGLVPLKGKGGCVSDSGTSPAGPCVHGRGLYDAERAVPSKNGRFLYVTGYSPPSPVTVVNRNPNTGTLSERSGKAACISSDGTSGDGSTCRTGRALNGGYAGALAPDGQTLYFSEYNANGVAIFHVSPTTGAFSQLPGKFGCVTSDGSSEKGANTCTKGRAIAGAYQVAIGASGRTVYVSSYGDNGVALFHATP